MAMMYRWDSVLERLVPVAFAVTKIVEVNPYYVDIVEKDLFYPAIVDFTDFAVDMRAISDSAGAETQIPIAVFAEDTYTPISISFSISVSMSGVTEDFTTNFE